MQQCNPLFHTELYIFTSDRFKTIFVDIFDTLWKYLKQGQKINFENTDFVRLILDFYFLHHKKYWSIKTKKKENSGFLNTNFDIHVKKSFKNHNST